MRSKYSLPVIILFLSTLVFFSISCGKKNEVRSFKEEIVEKEKPAMTGHGHGMDIPGATKTNIKWDTPDGWTSIKTESKLRLATYSVKSGNKEAVCTIIPLSGDAGGLKANVQMWFASIAEEEPSDSAIDEFIAKQKKFKTRSNNEGILIDFTTMTGKESDLSIIVSIITFPEKSLFIKL
ncbi:MAG: hypothetical protein ABFR75_14410, partial [Acidobacteriota bacterium]